MIRQVIEVRKIKKNTEKLNGSSTRSMPNGHGSGYPAELFSDDKNEENLIDG
jgi:hypothetical protein